MKSDNIKHADNINRNHLKLLLQYFVTTARILLTTLKRALYWKDSFMLSAHLSHLYSKFINFGEKKYISVELKLWDLLFRLQGCKG